MNLNKKSRKKYIINPVFQKLFFKRVLVLFFIVALACILFSLFLDMKMSIMVQNFYQNQAFVLSGKLNKFILMHLMFIFVLSIIIILWGICISHKIAGPIYRLKMHLNNITKNQPTTLLNFRKDDDFQDLAESFNNCILHLEDKVKQACNEKEILIKNIELIITDIQDETIKDKLMNMITNAKINETV